MPVGMLIDNILYNLAPADVLNGLFSTIVAHLEPVSWGERFPIILGKLYTGELHARDAEAAITEVRQIRSELHAIPPEYAIWDIKRIQQTIPNGSQIWKKAPNLAEFFRSSVGTSLLDDLEEDLEILKKKGGTARLLDIK